MTGMKAYGFPKGFRLRRRADFLLKRERTQKIHTRHFTIICRDNWKDGPRIGIVANKKVGNAVIRNRVKRLVREFFRLNRGRIHRSADIIVIARPMTRIERYTDIEEELKRVL